MAANITPIFTLTPVIGSVLLGTANTGHDGSGTIGTVLTAGSFGTRITRIIIKHQVTSLAGTVRLFIYTGAAYHLWREVVVTAITVSASVPGFEYIIELLGERALVLPTGYSLRACIEKAEACEVIAEGGDY